MLVLTGDTPRSRPTSSASSSRRTGASDAAATVLTFRPPRRPRVRPGRARRRRPRPRDRRGRGTPRPRSSRSREVNASIYVFRAERLWPALERLEPQNAQGELYLTDAVRFLVEDGETVAAHVARRPVRGRGRQHPRRAGRRGGRAPRPHQRARTCSPASRSSIRRTTWIEPDVELEPDVDDPSVRLPPRPHARRARGPRSTRTPSRSTPRSGAARPSARSVTFAPGRSSRPDPKAGTFVEIKNSRIGMRTNVPHLSYIGDAEVGEDTNLGAGAITANFPHQPGQAEEPHQDRQERQDRDPQWLRRPGRGRRRSMDSSRIGYHQGRAARRARSRAGAPGEQGGVCSPAPGRLSWFSRVSKRGDGGAASTVTERSPCTGSSAGRRSG